MEADMAKVHKTIWILERQRKELKEKKIYWKKLSLKCRKVLSSDNLFFKARTYFFLVLLMDPNGLGSRFLGDLSRDILKDLLLKHIIYFKICNPIFYNI